MSKFIPIQPEGTCARHEPLRIRVPRYDGDRDQLMPLVEAVAGEIAGPGGPLEGQCEIGAWLRGLRLADGEVELRLAAELGSCGEVVAAVAFDVLRRRLHDTDVFVYVDPPA
jgi:hypothetical protein